MSTTGQLLAIEKLNPKEHQIIFRRMGANATDVIFHHVHIPISLNKINEVVNKAIGKNEAFAENVYQETMMIITMQT
jgi:hypothetical protein